MIDIHTHLYFPQYDADRDETIRRAFDAGIRYMVSVGTGPEDWGQALAMTELPAADGRIGAAVGVHPNQGVRGEEYEVSEIQIRKLKEFISENREKIVAIGECGLDYFSRTAEPVSDGRKVSQKELFLAQVRLANDFGLPLIIHTRPSAGTMDAYEDVLDILTTYDLQPTTKSGMDSNEAVISRQSSVVGRILHCYVGDTEVTEKFLTLPDVFFSFTGNVTYPAKKSVAGTKDDLGETVKRIPLDRILIETDCPFLAPQARRGERNEPAYVVETAARIAELKGMTLGAVERSAEENAGRIFGTGKPV